MTTQELLAFQIDDAGYQLTKCFEGIEDAQGDDKLGEQMSPRETLEHLCECYTAFLAHGEGKEHSWGTYVAPNKTMTGLWATFGELRGQVVAALDPSTVDGCKHAHMYVIAHDYYHVGQMVSWRLAKTEGFDPYGIYRQ